ncbi:MAG: topoisomerase IV subunit A [Candidatus Tokpelaia sp. JSC085]|nr:MAG: topoisomerase IV subunit A [Candidatus Tokpelaia sp. JSC085]
MSDAVIPYSRCEHIEKIRLKVALEERYLAYALSTIMQRALPDVRDGLKPVHRRIFHAMWLLQLNPDQAYVKCARIIGDVMGKFHPHGDVSIYEALVRLAQDFTTRYPLIDGQGNFGNIDGDSAAAMRYTEARLTDSSMLLLEGISENAVAFHPTYNQEDEEPIVLPAAFPNLLANGASGIAVGMATSIPPHNIAELCEAALYLIAHPDASCADLVHFVPGPDFPTGGVLVESTDCIRDAYKTGRGTFRLQARWYKEEGSRGVYAIIVTEIPYQVQKARLLEKTAEILLARKLPLLGDIRDESAEDIRIVLEPRNRTVDPVLLMESLFRLTDFEVRVPLNMNVLAIGRVPHVLSLREVLQQWLTHRREVLQRRLEYRLKDIVRRLKVLSGYLTAYLNLDIIIRILREEDKPKIALIQRFNFSELQADAILNMRLRALYKLEELNLKKKFDFLGVEQKKIETLLSSEQKQWQAIAAEITVVRNKFCPDSVLGRRRTVFARRSQGNIQQAMIAKEPVTIIISEKGWLRALQGHLLDYTALSFKKGDKLKQAFHAMHTDKLLIVSTSGRFYTINANVLPGGRGHGEAIRILVDMDNNQDILTAFVHDPAEKLLVVSHCGYGFIIKERDAVANTRRGKQILNIKTPDKARFCIKVLGNYVAIVDGDRKMLAFPLSQIPEMSRGRGVRLQHCRASGISDIITFTWEEGIFWKDMSGRVFRRLPDALEEWRGNRASVGKVVPRGFPKSGKFYCL